jgi:hypothetical protein
VRNRATDQACQIGTATARNVGTTWACSERGEAPV